MTSGFDRTKKLCSNYLLLCDTALGNMKELSNRDNFYNIKYTIQSLFRKVDSVKATGKGSDIDNHI